MNRAERGQTTRPLSCRSSPLIPPRAKASSAARAAPRRVPTPPLPARSALYVAHAWCSSHRPCREPYMLIARCLAFLLLFTDSPAPPTALPAHKSTFSSPGKCSILTVLYPFIYSLFVSLHLFTESSLHLQDILLRASPHNAGLQGRYIDEFIFGLDKNASQYFNSQADVDTAGKPTGTGEVIFADETTMLAAAQHMNNQMIDGEKISVSELTLFDVKPEFFQRGGG
ncbi:hypothetical protein KSP39_PZI015645 [Platanthera zijinensis]|uniref:RRM domain-containing protein n=1 Tax=Platanthera zijinensis TaxID=2320716 RepID=A0AAP0G200_9ASPA